MTDTSSSATPISNDAFTFLTKAEYFRELIERIIEAKKGDRVLVAAMQLKVNEPLVRQLMDALCAAAGRGVQTSLVIDARTFPIMRKVPASRSSHNFTQTTLDALERLKAHGGSYVVANETYRRLMNPFAGRLHIKTAIINSEVYVGGCNLDRAGNIDMMVRWRDPKAADWLYKLMSEIIQHKTTKLSLGGEDKELILDKNTRLLVDAGRPKQSTTLEHALMMIDSAEKWIVMTCQFFPNSITARHLAQAYKRGVNVSLYFNRPGHPHMNHKILHHVVLMHERTRHPSELFEEQLHKDMPYLHAKLIATDKGAIIGSHNYVAAGVNFGTAELALLRHDSEFARRAAQSFLQQIN